MRALVVYESVYGNTHAVADAIAEGLGDAEVLSVHEAAGRSGEAELLVVGGPTHMHGLATSRSREMAAAGAEEDGGMAIDPAATKEPGLRGYPHDLPDRQGARAAAFDTRLDRSRWLSGVASRGIAKRLSRRGYDVLASESFLVDASEGPLAEGELDRAREWGAELAGTVTSGGASAQGAVS